MILVRQISLHFQPEIGSSLEQEVVLLMHNDELLVKKYDQTLLCVISHQKRFQALRHRPPFYLEFSVELTNRLVLLLYLECRDRTSVASHSEPPYRGEVLHTAELDGEW